MKKLIPYGRQSIDELDVKSVIKVLASDFLTQGPNVANLEQKVALYTGAAYAVAVSSGTAALHAACFAAGISKDDEVITTPMTFAASANCVLYCDGTPIFADIKRDLPLIDPNEISKKITPKTKAIIPVDYSGIPADYDEINQVAKKNNLVVIADAAHSFGGSYKNRKVGVLADMTVFSFHPVKLITTGEGGMVLTNNKKYYEKLLLFRTHGITKDENFMKQKNVGPWYHEMQDLGYNYRLTDIQAALGVSQLRKLDTFLKKRINIVRMYQKLLKNIEGVSFLSVSTDRTSGWHLFPTLLGQKLVPFKKQIVEALHKQGIKVQVHYIPTHLHPYYQNLFHSKEGDYPHAEAFYAREISLPLYPTLSNEEILYVIASLKKTIKKYS